MSNNFDAGSAAILSALLTGCITIIATFLTNMHLARQQKAKWEREESRLQSEKEDAEKKQEALLKKEETQRLQEIYSKAISSLAHLLIFDNPDMKLRPDYQQSLLETQKWLVYVMVYHYDKASEEYSKLLEHIAKFESGFGPIRKDVMDLRKLIIDFSSKDPRFKN